MNHQAKGVGGVQNRWGPGHRPTWVNAVSAPGGDRDADDDVVGDLDPIEDAERVRPSPLRATPIARAGAEATRDSRRRALDCGDRVARQDLLDLGGPVWSTSAVVPRRRVRGATMRRRGGWPPQAAGGQVSFFLKPALARRLAPVDLGLQAAARESRSSAARRGTSRSTSAFGRSHRCR